MVPICRLENIELKSMKQFLKLATHLSFLVFRRVRALFHEIVNQSLYTSHSITYFVHLWFCEKLAEKLVVLSSLTFCENTDRLARMAKCEMRKMIGEMVYEMLSISWLYTYRFSHFGMFVHNFVNYFVKLRTNHYTLFTISPISVISLWHFVKIPIIWRERWNMRWEKWFHTFFENFTHYKNRILSIFLGNFPQILKVISLDYFKENFTQFFKKFHAVFKKISLSNFKSNFTQFLWEFHSDFKRISCNF